MGLPAKKIGGALAPPGGGLERAVEELKQICGRVPEEIEKLIAKLSGTKALLKDAEQRHTGSHKVRLWFQEVKQIFLDAQDLVDEIATDAAVHSTGAPADRNIPAVTPAMGDRIREIDDWLDYLDFYTPMLGLQASDVEEARLDSQQWRQTGPLLPYETSIIGRDRETKQIIDALLTPAQVSESGGGGGGFSVLPIVGMGGIGKTTLAQLVFNDRKVKEHFAELMMWVCVSNNFDPKVLTKDMIDVALAFKGNHEQYRVDDWGSMQGRLRQEVEGKTFLLVLDDVWEGEPEPSMWEELLKPLHFGKNGSKVLVTSRDRSFVGKMQGGMHPPIELKGMSDADVWSLFKRYAFHGVTDADGNTHAEYSQLEDIGRGIVQRLKGSPLAARTIGSLLNNELDEQHWKTILESEFWRLEQESDGILPALQLSYQYLSVDLKQCFAYCSLFPKNHEFYRERVVQHWEAQSFIRKDRGTRMEIMGSKYFDVLLSRSLFESAPERDRYVMHDLIHDLAEYVSSNDSFRLENQKLMEMSHTIRHMSVCFIEIYQTDLNKLFTYEKLRTLLFLRSYHKVFRLSTRDLDGLFVNLKMLRVLGLRDCGIRGELPCSVGDLKHLRYIDLGANNDLRKLPESLGNLYNLQVLDLVDCDSLPALPGTMSQLVNLSCLSANSQLVSDIDGLGKLTGLQELQVKGRKVTELGGMCMLRELRVDYLEEVGSKEEAVQARLQTMEHLQVLRLNWCYGRLLKPELEEEVLQALRPSAGIKELHICRYPGAKWPDWMEVPVVAASFSSLRHFSLQDCYNVQAPPSFLSQLHQLEYLHIKSVYKWEEWSWPVAWDGDQNPNNSQQNPPSAMLFFPSLCELEIKWCPILRELPLLPLSVRHLLLEDVGLSCLPGLMAHSGDGVFASLSTLQIHRCNNLTSISSGLLQHHLPNLEEIKLKYCKHLVSLPERGLGHLISLKRLHITSCPKLAFPWCMPSSLERLRITKCFKLDHESLSACLHSLFPLKHLKLKNLKNLCSLPHGLNCLSSLQTLCICGCPSIQSLPTAGLPSSLKTLKIIDCPALAERHRNLPKSRWPEVSRIHNVYIDHVELK